MLRTTAIEAAAARGWTKVELARRTGLSVSTIYNLAWGTHTPSARAVEKIMAAFPDLPFERLFVPVDSGKVVNPSTPREASEVAA